MRRLLFAVSVVAAVLALGGCGSSSAGSAQSPTAHALSYLPTSSPFMLTLATDPKSAAVRQAKSLTARNASVGLLLSGLYSELARNGLSYAKDVRPLFGNPLVFGIVGSSFSRSTAGGTPFLLAWVTRSASTLARLVPKLGAGDAFRKSQYDGATLYTGVSVAVAVDGPTLLLSRSPAVVEQALDRHKHGGGVTSPEYTRDLAGSAGGALMTIAGNLTGLLSTPKAAQARRVPWVAAIRGYGVSLQASSTGTTMRFHVDTSGSTLSASQLPFTAGSTAPALAGAAPIQAGLHGLVQTIDFAEAASQVADPSGYARFTTKIAQLKRRTGFDLHALVSMLTGDVQLASDGSSTIARTAVADPAAVSRMLAELARAPGLAFKAGTRVAPLGGGLYEIVEHSKLLTMGVVGHELLFGKATPAQVRAFATASGAPATNGSGAVAFRIDLPQLIAYLAHGQLPGIDQVLLGQLGDLTGSAEATPAGLNGSALLSIK